MAKIVGKVVVTETNQGDDTPLVTLVGVFDDITEAESYVKNVFVVNDLPFEDIRQYKDQWVLGDDDGSTTWTFYIS